MSRHLSCLASTTVLLQLVAIGSWPRECPADEPVRGGEVSLELGDALPEFDGIDDGGNVWDSRDHVGRGYLVICFYAGDFTRTGTRRAVTFREQVDRLAREGIEVVGISGDRVETHGLFKRIHELNFTLLSDPRGEVAKRLGVPFRQGGKARAKTSEGKAYWIPGSRKSLILHRGITTACRTFVVDRRGMLIYKSSREEPSEDFAEMLEAIRRHKEAS